MKLSFTGDSLAEIHQQILEAAKTIGAPVVLDNYKPEKGPEQEYDINYNNPILDDVKYKEAEPTEIDGYRISNGQVWVPMEDRPSAFRGIAVEKYVEQKLTKESGALLDSKGTPYDPSIHTSTKAKKNDGTWKLRPGGGSPKVEDKPVVEQVEEVEPELAPVIQDKPKTVQDVVAHENAGPPIGRAPSMHNYESFKSNLMNIVVVLINDRKITREYMQDLNNYFGVTNLWDVKQDEAKCQQLFKLFLDYQFIMGT